MKFNYIDSEYYLLKAPYMSLMRPSAGAKLVEKEVKNVRGYAKFIPEFPNIKCEPLEFIYLCHEALCAVDELFFDDLIRFGWRGVVWASWLAAVTPSVEKYMMKSLNLAIDEVPQNRWIVELALLSLSNATQESHFLLEPVYEIKRALAIFPYTKLPLRKWYSEEYIARKQREGAKILSVYEKYGTNAALEEIKKLPKTDQDLPYKEWVLTQKKSG